MGEKKRKKNIYAIRIGKKKTKKNVAKVSGWGSGARRSVGAEARHIGSERGLAGGWTLGAVESEGGE